MEPNTNQNPKPTQSSSPARPFARRENSRYRTNRPTSSGSRPASSNGQRPYSRNGASSTGGPRKTEGGRGKRRPHQQRRRSNTAPALTHRMTITGEKNPVLPEVTDEDTVRVIPVSGVVQF